MASRKGKGRKILIQTLVLVGILGGFFGYRYVKGEPEPEPPAEIRAPVITMVPVQGSLKRSLSINGYLESKSMVTVLPMVSGLLTELNVQVGDQVTEGQVIGKVDAESLELQMKQAEAAFLSADSSYDRVSKLFEAGATSQQNYDQTKSQYEAYKSQYELAQLQFNYAMVEAPVTGAVLQKHTNAGSLVGPQAPLVTIADLDELHIRVDIPEKYYDVFLEHRQSMELYIERPDVPGDRYSGSIDSISPFITAETKTFEITVSAPELPRKLRPGMYVRTSFILEEQPDALSIPFDALVSGNTLWYVDPDTQTAHSRNFTLDFYNDVSFSVPREFRNRQIIIEGQHFLKEGQKVRVLNQEG